MNFKILTEAASKKTNSIELIHEITDILDEHFELMKIEHPKHYWETMMELYEVIEGPHFTEETSKYAVSMFENQDGTKGEHWSMSDTKNVALSNGVSFDKFNDCDWYYVLNLMYSDYYSTIGSNIPVYISLAKDWLTSKNAPIGKAFKYWMVTIDK